MIRDVFFTESFRKQFPETRNYENSPLYCIGNIDTVWCFWFRVSQILPESFSEKRYDLIAEFPNRYFSLLKLGVFEVLTGLAPFYILSLIENVSLWKDIYSQLSDNLGMFDKINIDEDFWDKLSSMPEDKFNDALDFFLNLKNIKGDQEEKALNLKIADALVRAAKNDLKAISPLYEQENYSLSTYHLQQTVEKITKAYGLAFNLIKRNELGGKKGVGHDSPLMFVRGVEKHELMKYVLALKHFKPEIRTDVDQLELIVKEKKIEIARTEENVAIVYLQLIDNLYKKLDTKELRDMIEILAGVMISFTLDDEDKVKKAEKFFEKNFKMNYIISFIALYLLACLTFPHEAFTRYPDRALKPEEYKKGMGIVDATPRLIPYIEKIIKDIEEFLILKNQKGTNGTPNNF